MSNRFIFFVVYRGCPDKTSGDKMSADKMSRDEMSRGSKCPDGQNVWETKCPEALNVQKHKKSVAKASLGQNVWWDKMYGGTKHLVGQDILS